MDLARRVGSRAALLLALCAGSARAEDPPAPGAAPAPQEEEAKALRNATLRRATGLQMRALVLERQGKVGEALPMTREALALAEGVLGPEDPALAIGLVQLGRQLMARGLFLEAQPALERSVALSERKLGPHALPVALALANLAEVLRQRAELEAAELAARRSWAIVERVYGPDHADVASALMLVGLILEDRGDLDGALDLVQRSVATRIRALGETHADVALALNNLGALQRARGDLAAAEDTLRRALRLGEAASGLRDPSVVNNLALVLEDRSAYGEARTLYEEAIGQVEAREGKEHPLLATLLGNLGVTLLRQAALPEARRCHERELSILERAWGPEHPDVAGPLESLAAVLLQQGEEARAVALQERAVALLERAFGPEHPRVALSAANLALTLSSQGAHDQALRLLERSVAIQERALGVRHPALAAALNNLAAVQVEVGAKEPARANYERALEVGTAALGAGHPTVAATANNLGVLLEGLGDSAAALALYERSLSTHERLLGPQHPLVGQSLANLGNLLVRMGQGARGRAALERALAIREAVHGSEHPDVAVALQNLAVCLQALGARGEAQAHMARALRITEQQARGLFPALDGTRRRQLMAATRARLDTWLDLVGADGASGYAEILRFKGIVARAEAAERALARHAPPEARERLARLAAVEGHLSRLTQALPGVRQAAARARWQADVARLSSERVRIETGLAAEVAPLRVARERLDLGVADVQRALPPDAVLVDLLRVRERYLAVVVPHAGEPRRVELGPAEPIEAALSDLLRAIEGGAREPGEAGARLRALLWTPLEPHVPAGLRHVVLCPDGALACLPFAALPGRAPGSFLIDDVALAHVGCAQDLVPPVEHPAPGVGALLVGGVDYERAEGGAQAPPTSAGKSAFQPLLATRQELSDVASRWREEPVVRLEGAQATEAALRAQVRGKRLVHVATHGYVREDVHAGLHPGDRRGWSTVAEERRLAAGHDPLLLSGLALAGANRRQGGGEDDGLLTALEASRLDLEGVELVALSACETARGTAVPGEGVLGLVQSFQGAGSERVLASLWKVDDEATRLLMGDFYARWLDPAAPAAPAQALRAAARGLRDRTAGGDRSFAALRLWAAFVVYGR